MEQEIRKKGEVILYHPSETIKLEVRLENETVWLTQAQMAELFGTKRQAITKHLKNIFDCGELLRAATSSVLELLQPEGNRMVKRTVELFNLDVIISVGYRVNTSRGIQFRQWALQILKEYLLKGYSVNQHLVALQEKMDNRFAQVEQRLDEHDEQIAFFIRTNQPPIEGVFYEGQVLDARDFAETLIKSAQKEVLLIDNYIDARTFEILEVRGDGVRAWCWRNSSYKYGLRRN